MTGALARRIALIGGALLCALLFGLGIGVRRHVLEAQMPSGGRPLPFTLESALQFRMVRSIYAGEAIPALDRDIEHPTGVRTWAHDTVGAEYVYAALARLFPTEITLTQRVRWIEVVWFCLGVPLLAFGVRRWTGSWVGGATAGFFYAVAIASVLRSTGQEISHENFALPLLIGHLAFAFAPAGRAAGRRAHAASALLLAGAVASWDMIQYYVLLWGMIRAFDWLRRPYGAGDPRAPALLWPWAALVLTALASPYHRTHGLLISPAMAPAHAAVAGWLVHAWAARTGAKPAVGLARGAFAAVLAAALAASALLPASYGHFGALLAAKIRFLNVKPADPSLLTFDQRILWVPALHSVDWRMAIFYLPFILPLTLAASVVFFVARRKNEGSSPYPGWACFSHWFSLVVFLLFFRFCVFVALFASILLGLWAAWAVKRSGWGRALALAAIAAGGVGEMAHTVRNAGLWGPQGVLYPQLEELGAWLRANVSPKPVLANFQTSGFVLAYGRCPIVLHPKFEAPEARRRVEQYATHLFRGTERGLRDWADRYGARYLVYSMYEFADRSPELTLRYMVEALKPPAEAPARLFEFEPERARLFRLVWSNAKYRVFRIVTGEDERVALQRTTEAEAAFREGRLDDAERLATEALQRSPRDERAGEVLGHVGSLRSQGVGSANGKP